MTALAPVLAVWLAALLAAGAPDEADRIRRGDRRAFRRFFDATHGDLLRALARRGLDPATADDLAQQAYVWIWEHRDRIDPARSLRGLLFRIGLTRGLNAVRDAARTGPLLDAELRAAEPGDPAALADLRLALAQAVAELPERRRQTFTLCFFDGLTHREAADVMGVSPKTVEHQMGHALKAVRERLGRFLGP
ncbi:RNA polymerase sigma factor [Rubrivirga sp. IMCC43871]|uniref:RNA polymerase sigma factor n=1 Tax=Rubrivirga sp. IMCC43871 TaxID=3391575 RepID=UPI00398FD7EB